MSRVADEWALRVAPVPPGEPIALLVLIGLARHADESGRGCRPSIARLAEYARCSPRTVHNKLRLLIDHGLIRRGDQSLVEHLPPNRRPVVYDLVMSITGVNDVHPRSGNQALGVHVVHPKVAPLRPENPAEGRISAGQTGVNEVHPSNDCEVHVLHPKTKGLSTGVNAVHPNERFWGERGDVSGVNACADNRSLEELKPPPNPLHADLGVVVVDDRSQVNAFSDASVRRTAGGHPPSRTVATSNLGDDAGPIRDVHPARAVIRALPDSLQAQISLGPVRQAVHAALGHGWTLERLVTHTASRSWLGAGPGAVVAWLRDLEPPADAVGPTPLQGAALSAVLHAWATVTGCEPYEECPHGVLISRDQITAAGVVKCALCRHAYGQVLTVEPGGAVAV